MAEAILSVSMDEMLMHSFEALCNDFGMSPSTAMNVFAKAVVRERKIPFDIKSDNYPVTLEGAKKAFYSLREEASNLPEITLDEINKEIAETRAERKK